MEKFLRSNSRCKHSATRNIVFIERDTTLDPIAPGELSFDITTLSGNKLSIKNNTVVIGEGVSYILVSCFAYIGSLVQDESGAILILKNGETSRTVWGDTNVSQIVLTPILIPVIAGDVIKFAFTASSETNKLTRYNFIVEAID